MNPIKLFLTILTLLTGCLGTTVNQSPSKAGQPTSDIRESTVIRTNLPSVREMMYEGDWNLDSSQLLKLKEAESQKRELKLLRDIDPR